MKYMNGQGELVSISVADEKWLDDEFFGGEMAKLPADAPRAGLAYRVSTKGQVDHDDIPMQKIECRKFCVTHGWRVVFEKAEKGVSGSKVSADKRDVIQEMRTEALNGAFDILLVFMFDRLGRIESETPFVLEWFVQHGIQMWSVKDGQQKIESHCDKLINYIRFWQAAGESEKTAMRISTRMRQIVSSGHYAGGTVPFGYRAVHKGRMNKRDQPVKDLELVPEEAELVAEIFSRIANEGASAYALARELNERGITTHRGTKFQTNNILRIVKHRGYTGCVSTQNAQSDIIPELRIVDEATFERANEIVSQRTAEYNEVRRTAKNCRNTTLLAGVVYCAHCGARMSGFMHNDRYKLADGVTRERIVAKYNCFQRAQKLRDCDGQALYKADIVDGIVLDVVRKLFERIKDAPRNRSVELKLKEGSADRRAKKAAAEKKIKDCQYALERYESEVLRCIDGQSSFSQEMLSNLITKAEAELQRAKQDYAKLIAQADEDKDAARQTKAYFNEFLGWADEFDMATLERKRMILGRLISRVEVGKGYAVKVVMNVSYEQFVRGGGGEGGVRTGKGGGVSQTCRPLLSSGGIQQKHCAAARAVLLPSYHNDGGFSLD